MLPRRTIHTCATGGQPVSTLALQQIASPWPIQVSGREPKCSQNTSYAPSTFARLTQQNLGRARSCHAVLCVLHCAHMAACGIPTRIEGNSWQPTPQPTHRQSFLFGQYSIRILGFLMFGQAHVDPPSIAGAHAESQWHTTRKPRRNHAILSTSVVALGNKRLFMVNLKKGCSGWSLKHSFPAKGVAKVLPSDMVRLIQPVEAPNVRLAALTHKITVPGKGRRCPFRTRRVSPSQASELSLFGVQAL